MLVKGAPLHKHRLTKALRTGLLFWTIKFITPFVGLENSESNGMTLESLVKLAVREAVDRQKALGLPDYY
jgi:putative Mn2+ efflux pump MntP